MQQREKTTGHLKRSDDVETRVRFMEWSPLNGQMVWCPQTRYTLGCTTKLQPGAGVTQKHILFESETRTTIGMGSRSVNE